MGTGSNDTQMKMPRDPEKYFREKYGLGKDNFGYHQSDLYVRGETDEQTKEIFNEVTSWGYSSHRLSYSNVPGHEWYGKLMVEIPFARMDVILDAKKSRSEDNEVIHQFIDYLIEQGVFFGLNDFPGAPTFRKLTETEVYRMKVDHVEKKYHD